MSTQDPPQPQLAPIQVPIPSTHIADSTKSPTQLHALNLHASSDQTISPDTVSPGERPPEGFREKKNSSVSLNSSPDVIRLGVTDDKGSKGIKFNTARPEDIDAANLRRPSVPFGENIGVAPDMQDKKEDEEEDNPLERSVEFLVDDGADGEDQTAMPESLKNLLNQADVLFQRLSANSSLLDKLRAELIEAKFKYGQYQTELASAEHEAAKLKKLKESQSASFGEIVQELVSIVFIKGEGEGAEVEALQGFQELVEKCQAAIEKGDTWRVEFTFMSEDESGGVVKKKGKGDEGALKPLTGEKFEKSKWFGGLSNIGDLFTKLKEPYSIEKIQKNPNIVECTEKESVEIEKVILPLAKANWQKGRKALREHLKNKFFPNSLRSRLWKSYLPNPAGITRKLYTIYKENLNKHLAGGSPTLGNQHTTFFGSTAIISKNIKTCLEEMAIPLSPNIIDGVIRIVQIFEQLHPDVGYVIGTERLAILIRGLVGIEEDRSFVIFYNIYFNSEFLWGILTSDPASIQAHLNGLRKLVSAYSNAKDMYAVNKQPLERFFIESAQSLYIGVLSAELCEKIIDFITAYDDTILFYIMVVIVKKFGNFDLNGMSYEKARAHLTKKVKEITDAEFALAILVVANSHKEIRETFEKGMTATEPSSAKK